LTGAAKLLASVAAALLATAASADPPNLNVIEGDAGETELEMIGFISTGSRGAPRFQFNGELSHVVTDSFGVELQLTGSREHTGSTLRAQNLELQLLAKVSDLPRGGSLGVSAEAALGLSHGEDDVGGLVYAILPIRGWTLSLNIGGERSLTSREASFVYAWAFEREFGEWWSVRIEGGGERALQGDQRPEHYAGPFFTWQTGRRDGSPKLALGYLAGLSSASPNLFKIGLIADF